MKNKKGLVLSILIIISLLILAVVAYFFSQKSLSSVNVKLPTGSPKISDDPAANWNVYSNSKYKYMFKVPTNLRVANEFEYDPKWIQNKNLIHGLEIKNGDVTVYSLAVFKSNKLSIDDWVYQDNMAMPDESVNTSSFSMNGLDIMLYEGNYNKFYLFKKEEIIYSLTTNKTADSEPKQILSTFKFVGDIQNICYYGGKEYKVGDQFKALDGCNSCTCEGTRVSCTEMACQ